MADTTAQRPFASFFIAGFECASQKARDGRRLDLLAATGHDMLAEADYRLAAAHGLRAARDGLRWHLIERGAPGAYDWSSFLPMLRAARRARVQVIWDLCHYGYPDGLRVWDGAFVERFARFAAAAARLIREETGAPGLLCPINEISYWAWAGGDKGRFAPAARGRGDELKRQLARAAIAASERLLEADPAVRLVHTDPLINVVAGSARPEHVAGAAGHHEAQFHAWDMVAGRREPGLGGRPALLDLVGVNYYSDNQWFGGGPTIQLGHARYRPLRSLLATAHGRYGRPLFVAETGAEGCGRAAWLHYVGAEVRKAMAAGVPVEGVCLYPLLDYPGWEDGRPCAVGLFGPADADGARPVDADLAEELRRQQGLIAAAGAEVGAAAPALRLLNRAG